VNVNSDKLILRKSAISAGNKIKYHFIPEDNATADKAFNFYNKSAQ